ncbi:MAG: putative bifunctional diguanylate cyclase/phosphodiesterase [Neptuniibacter sp.]
MKWNRVSNIVSEMKLLALLIAFCIVLLAGLAWYETDSLGSEINQQLKQEELFLQDVQQELSSHVNLDSTLNDIAIHTSKFFLEFELVTLDPERGIENIQNHLAMLAQLKQTLHKMEREMGKKNLSELLENLIILQSVGDELATTTSTSDRFQLYRDNILLVTKIESYISERRHESLRYSYQMQLKVGELQQVVAQTRLRLTELVFRHSIAMGVAMFVGFVIAILFMRYVFSIFRERFELLENYAIDIGRGHYQKPPFSSKDFTGRLAVRMGLMSRTIRGAFDKLHQSREEVEELAYYDNLTGLENRLLFHENLENAVVLSRRYEERFALAYLDIDYFKEINDAHGHGVGDAVLVEISARLQQVLRQDDHTARLGGDEFAILFRCDNLDISELVERILLLLQEPIAMPEMSVKLSGSIGVAILGEDADNSTDLMRFADMALYKSKQSGRNTYHYFSEKLERKLFEKRKLLAELEAAIEGDQLELHYQPQHDMKSRKIVGVEALIRWPLPGGEYRYPDLFIPLAEEGELIFSLGEWIIKRACRDGRQLLDRAGPLTIAINLSSKQFKDPNLKEMIVHHCKQYQIPHHCIELEITESLLLSNINEAANMLGKLRMEGFNISLDDFGTGYSSNFYLKSIPVTGIKIDRLFTAGIPFEKKDTAIVETTIDLATRLDLKVIAEGVETEEQFNHLLGFGCEVAQGYLLNKPMPMSELIAQITETRKIREHNIQRITR